jgi:hypothetical protein
MKTYSDAEISAICKAAREREAKATPGPLTFEKKECRDLGSWHYAIKTAYNHPAHPHSPRFIAWLCGSLGEITPSRRTPDDARNDPEIEADIEFFIKAHEDIPALLDIVEQLQHRLEQEVTRLKEELKDLQATFDLRWDADMRAIKRWQEAHPGNDLVWPDHVDLVMWLAEQQIETLAAAIQSATEAGKQKTEVERLIVACNENGEKMKFWLEAAETAEAERDALRVALDLARPQLEYIQITGCPCGAREESTHTHPHVGGCGIDALTKLARAALAGEPEAKLKQLRNGEMVKADDLK